MINRLKILQTFKILLPALILVFGIQYAVAATNWTAPTGSPPGNNTEALLSVSNSLQTKTGGLVVASGSGTNPGFLVLNGDAGIGLPEVNGVPGIPSNITIYSDLEVGGFVKGAGFCIGSNCINSWPIGVPGVTPGVSQIIPGNGISIYSTLPPDGGSGDFTIENIGIDGITPQTKIKIVCIANNPTLEQLPFLCGDNSNSDGGWQISGVFDNGGSSWCLDPDGSGFKRWSGDAVLCHRPEY